MTVPFCWEGTGCSGATGHKRQRGVVEGLAQVAESMSHMGIRTEGSGLPAQRSLCYTMLPLVGETGQSDGKGKSFPRLWGSGKVPGCKGACEGTEVGAAWQPGRLSEEVKLGLGFQKQRLV